VPAGLSFFTDSSDSTNAAQANTLFLGGLGGVRLARIQLTWGDGNSGDLAGPVTAQCQEELFVSQFGRIRALAQGPDGYLYFSTTNGDGRGVADPEGDRVFRVRPPS